MGHEAARRREGSRTSPGLTFASFRGRCCSRCDAPGHDTDDLAGPAVIGIQKTAAERVNRVQSTLAYGLVPGTAGSLCRLAVVALCD